MDKGADKKELNVDRSTRRDVIKAVASLPILGFFGYELSQLQKAATTTVPKVDMIKELGLGTNVSFEAPAIIGGNANNTIRLGIIGAGSRSRALLFHLGFTPKRNMEKMPKEKYRTWMGYTDLNVVLSGVCEVFDQRAERAMNAAVNSVKAVSGGKNLPKVKRYARYRDLLESNEIDAVIIATPDHLHAKIAMEAIQAGKHVYCEKGPSHSEGESYSLYDTVKGSGLVYQLGHQIRHNPIYAYAADLVKKDVLGQVNLVEVTTNRNSAHGAWVRHLNNGKPKPGSLDSIDWEQWLGDSPKVPFSLDRYYNWSKYWDYGTGLLGQLFSHEFDAANGILNCGIPSSVMCSGGIYYYQDGREIPDLMQVVLEYPEQKMSMIYSATLANSKNRGRLFMGRDASMEIGKQLAVTADRNSEKYKERLEAGQINSKEPMFTVGPDTSSKPDATSGATSSYYEERGLTSVNIDGESKDVTHLHLREWLNAIRTGSEVSCGIERAFEEAVTIQMAKKSYMEKRQVQWDAANRKIV